MTWQHSPHLALFVAGASNEIKYLLRAAPFSDTGPPSILQKSYIESSYNLLDPVRKVILTRQKWLKRKYRENSSAFWERCCPLWFQRNDLQYESHNRAGARLPAVVDLPGGEDISTRERRRLYNERSAQEGRL